jgi:iron complex outermembrane receptor protein
MQSIRYRLMAGAASTLAGLAILTPVAKAADAAALPAPPTAAVDEVVVTGVRGSQARTIANSPAPIDIISRAQLTETGKVGLKEILSTVIPSLSLPAQNGGGTSASVKPFAVDGLSGDYVLVLINGKRRHSTALINNLPPSPADPRRWTWT